jgi:hypothetical protein
MIGRFLLSLTLHSSSWRLKVSGKKSGEAFFAGGGKEVKHRDKFVYYVLWLLARG